MIQLINELTDEAGSPLWTGRRRQRTSGSGCACRPDLGKRARAAFQVKESGRGPKQSTRLDPACHELGVGAGWSRPERGQEIALDWNRTSCATRY